MRQHKNTASKDKYLRYVVLPSMLVIFVVLGITAYRNLHPSTSAARIYTQSLNLPFTPVLPNHLPVSAYLEKTTDKSYFDQANKMLVLRWIFPAQTLPGQGTLIAYEYVNANHNDGPLPKITGGDYVQFMTGDVTRVATLAHLFHDGDAPAQPGERVLRTEFGDMQVLLVSYALSDEELLKVAASMQ